MTDLIDADSTACSATTTGLAGVMNDVLSDETPATEIPLVAPAQAAPALPPPTMTASATSALPPPSPGAPLTPPGVPDLAPTPPAPSGSVDPVPAAPVPPVLAPTAPAAPAPAEPQPAEEAPALITGPAAILAPDPSDAPLEQSVPALPAATAVAPANTAAAAVAGGAPTPLSIDDLLGPQTGAQKPLKQGSAIGRFFKRLIILAMLGGAGYAAYTYGPDLYEQYANPETTDTANVDAAPEVDAPLAFPNAAPAPTPIRTAEFILEGLPGAPEMSYRVTTDFETNVSQVDVIRPNAPDLQILTYGEAALIRKMGEDQWYQLERGRFPLDDRLERSDWVRQLNELLPTSVRSSVTIDDAGETSVSGVPTRRLALTLDVSLLGGTDAAAAAADTVVEPVPPAPPTDPAAPTGPAATSLTTSIEVWVDAQGLVRKVSGVPQLGAETITVVRADGAAWVPDYPTPDFVQPLTAATLVELAI